MMTLRRSGSAGFST